MASAFTLSRPEPDIGLLTFDLPGKGANILSSAVLDELSARLDEVEQWSGLAGLILASNKPGSFIAGADLREILTLEGAPAEQVMGMCQRGHALLSRLSRIPAVTVAAINGACLGGGTELALWCDQRLVADTAKTQVGLPEAKLGFIPGWGGTVRLPRIIGLPLAAEMIAIGEPVTAKEAVGMGLATDIVPADRLIAAAIDLVRAEQRSQAYLQERTRRSQPVELLPAEVGFLRTTLKERIAHEAHGYQSAARAALDHLFATAPLIAEAALTREAEQFAALFGTPENKALLHVFFLVDRNKRDPGVEHPTADAPQAKCLGVIGAGIMGAGIAAAAIRNGLPAVLTDAVADNVDRAVPLIIEEAAYEKRSKRTDAGKVLEVTPLLHGALDPHAVERCDLVIEAIVENREVKQQLFARIEPRLSARAILASNTSTIPITRLAQGLARPDRFCGMHFFNPVRRMKLVEVIRGKETSDETIAEAVALAKRIGKMPVVVNDGPGFMVNRLLFPYMNEAIELIHDGLSIEQIDRAAVAFGMPIGPIALYDMVGLDTAMYAGRTMYEAFPDRVAASPLIPAMVKQGRLGQKAGRGFFSYANKKKTAEPDPAVPPFLEKYHRRQIALSDDDVQARLLLPMLLEATRLLEENVARDVRDVDLGLIYGLGFPANKGGLLYWADTLGARRLLEMLKPWEALGPRLRPTPMLLDMAETGGTFYGN